MTPLFIETNRLIISEFTEDMCEAVHKNSLDDATREFVPDEVFETAADALATIRHLTECYNVSDAPKVYPISLKTGEHIGYVQAVPFDDALWEVGYKIAEQHRGNYYAAEAVTAFLPVIMPNLNLAEIIGICQATNLASISVLERCGFVFIGEKSVLYYGEPHKIRKYKYNLINGV